MVSQAFSDLLKCCQNSYILDPISHSLHVRKWLRTDGYLWLLLPVQQIMKLRFELNSDSRAHVYIRTPDYYFTIILCLVQCMYTKFDLIHTHRKVSTLFIMQTVKANNTKTLEEKYFCLDSENYYFCTLKEKHCNCIRTQFYQPTSSLPWCFSEES